MNAARALKRVWRGLSDLPANIRDYGTNKTEFGGEIAKAIFKRRLLPPGKTPRYIAKIYGYIEKEFESQLAAYRDSVLPSVPPADEKVPVWVCWWQGFESAPEIVRLCVSRLEERLPDYAELRLITKDNYRDYAALPDFLVKKHEDKQICTAHFSDVLRFCLLEKHGGMWIDATVYLTGELRESCLKSSYFSPKVSDKSKKPGEASEGKWSGFLMAGCKGNPLFGFVRDCLLAYWQKHDRAVDYVFFDYIMMTAYRNIPAVRAQMDALPPNNEDIWELLRRMNKPFDAQYFARLSSENDFAKLTYKRGFTPQANGQKTYYAMLRDGEI